MKLLKPCMRLSGASLNIEGGKEGRKKRSDILCGTQWVFDEEHALTDA